MPLNTSKEFFNTSESKIHAEFNNVTIEEQENRKGILFIGANPHWEGSENNIIYQDLFHEFSQREFCVMKLAFRPYSSDLFKKHDYEDIKYVRDASIAVDYFFSKFSCVKFFMVIGYSWGSSIAFNLLMRRPEISSFILISPTLSLKGCDFTSGLSVFKTRGLIIHGEADQMTSPSVVLQYTKLLQSKKMNVQHHLIPAADHYYNTGFHILKGIVFDYIKSLGNNPNFHINSNVSSNILEEAQELSKTLDL